MKMTYYCKDLSTGKVFKREAEFVSVSDYCHKINKWNKDAEYQPEVRWAYYGEFSVGNKFDIGEAKEPYGTGK